MKKVYPVLFIIMLLAAYSCNEASGYGEAIVGPAAIQKSLKNWLYYNQSQVTLSKNFTALNEIDDSIGKGTFLKQLTTGNYLPLRLHAKDSAATCYKLYPLNSGVDNEIRETIKCMAQVEYEHYRMEGKPLPAFSFTDLTGKVYNKKNTKGKILVLKCWFINCTGCVKEMPLLNTLVDKYKDRDDIVFISLASDTKDSLQAFLSNRPFKYAIVPQQEPYMFDRLKVNAFPTHLIINKNGVIVKEVNTAAELIATLQAEAGRKM